MKVVITGGAGFIGGKLACQLLKTGCVVDADQNKIPITKVVVFDRAPSQLPLPKDSRLTFVYGDITNQTLIKEIIDDQTVSVFHFAGIVSGQAESDLELGMRINIDGTRGVLDVCRSLPKKPKVIFASTISVYGDNLPSVVTDDTPTFPILSYGTQKLCCEYLINDYSRRGHIDGRSVRIPTVAVRPGKPNQGVGQWTSSFFREPLSGHKTICPVSKNTHVVMLSVRRLVASILHIHDVSGDLIGPQRGILLPALSVQVIDMINALEKAGGSEILKLIDYKLDPFIQKIQDRYPRKILANKATQLGVCANQHIDEIVQEFVEDDLANQMQFNREHEVS